MVLDTETTGMPVTDGHRVLEIGCVEVVGRRLTGRNFHIYLQPDRESDEGAIAVHGITSEFLRDKPRFADVADEFYEYIQGATLVIHNAAFDVGFLNNEFALLGQADRADLSQYCTIVDSLGLARARHPGQRNNLDALCKRYGIDLSERTLHGALLDAELLADVYLAMTGGQTSLSLAGNANDEDGGQAQEARSAACRPVAPQGGSSWRQKPNCRRTWLIWSGSPRPLARRRYGPRRPRRTPSNFSWSRAEPSDGAREGVRAILVPACSGASPRSYKGRPQGIRTISMPLCTSMKRLSPR